MQYSDSPVHALVLRHLRQTGTTRKDLAEALATGSNRSKAFRRLDQLLQGERLVPEFVRRVADVLQIPRDALAAAWDEHARLGEEAR